MFIELGGYSRAFAKECEIAVNKAGLMLGIGKHVDCRFKPSSSCRGIIVEIMVGCIVRVVRMEVFVAEVAMNFSTFVFRHGFKLLNPFTDKYISNKIKKCHLTLISEP